MLVKQVLTPDHSLLRKSGLKLEPAHFQQGDFDGACGVYCLILALVRLGVLSKRAATRLFDVHDSRKGFVSTVREHYFQGTTLQTLKQYARHFPTVSLLPASCRTLASACRNVTKAIDQGSAVLAWVTGRGLEHWILIVGYQEEVTAKTSRFTALLALDPSESAPGFHGNNAWLITASDLSTARFVTQSGRSWDATIHHLAVITAGEHV